MNKPVRYLTLEEVLHIQKSLIDEFGGSHGVRDMGLISSAVLRPQMGYYADIIEEAAALWESIAMNHGFVDGNKRIGFAAMEIFLDLNGIQLEEDDDRVIEFIYRLLEEGEFHKDRLDAWLRNRTTEVSGDV